MPHYFLDYQDSFHDLVDVDGRELDNDEHAATAARSMLAGRACLEILRGADAVISVRVRRGPTPLFSVTLAITEDRFHLNG
ncbi:MULTISPECIES: hypothetical protein [unclassified Bosea (in: a-proteobacteria)]|uniref:DUF6894 family protein n=1 Tax=unclassified Bosea (in: a-proteobacteria) TaxID=2653178 RepID=UPI000F762D3C|nr:MULTISPECIES: hypothetical protein [unclassified Bosea (in: a-proteobacteria)]AZO81855.1 hypothetical protein BLM15_28985 [Bosea sp. Tri-49]RXT16772.1 hypothetical protein B5U98_26790 [Bosea sp. Tri-39]RXT37530.1 hypothetical protein B5U99_12625 [Bosea sp. Tri-54]